MSILRKVTISLAKLNILKGTWENYPFRSPERMTDSRCNASRSATSIDLGVFRGVLKLIVLLCCFVSRSSAQQALSGTTLTWGLERILLTPELGRVGGGARFCGRKNRWRVKGRLQRFAMFHPSTTNNSRNSSNRSYRSVNLANAIAEQSKSPSSFSSTAFCPLG
jgi:hypothetical protein